MGTAFGNRIKEIRIMKGLTQQNVADECGVAVPTVARWEAGALSPSIRHQEILANALGTTVDSFYISPDLPVPTTVVLKEILKTVQQLAPEEQQYILEMARGLLRLNRADRL